MENRNIIAENTTDHDTQNNTIKKWIRILYICQIAYLFTTAFGAIAALGNVVGWISRIITVAVIVSLFNLAEVNERYRKASLFYSIFVVGGVLAALLNKNMFGMILSVCSIIASYQELNGHSEITAPKNTKLSKKWHSLFYYQLVVGLISGFFSSAGVVIAVLAEMRPEIIVSVALIITALVGVVLSLFHILYLKQTLRLFSE